MIIKEYDYDTNELLNETRIDTDIIKEFAYDNCHKIYLIEDNEDREQAQEYGYDLYPIEDLGVKYEDSCPLKFISNWKLDKRYVEQCKKGELDKEIK